MLVSEMSYFQMNKNGLNDYSVAVQTQKSNMSEGFGHYNRDNFTVNENKTSDKSFIKHISNLFKSAFSKDKQEDKKSISIIA